MSASRVETTEGPPRRDSTADVRASQFLKKVSIARRKSLDGKRIAVPEVYQRTVRSMDLGPKDYATLAGQHTVHIGRNSHTPSPSGASSSESGPEHAGFHVEATVMPSHTSSPPQPAPEQPRVARREEASSRISFCSHPADNRIGQDSRQPDGSPHTSMGGLVATGRGTVDGDVIGAPVMSESMLHNSRPAASSSSTPKISFGSGQASPGLSDRRNLAPRLATLPAPMMARYMAKGSARLTPSIVSWQPNMPVLNLPPLPTVTPTIPPERPRQQAPLRSIPALPMRGPSEAEQEADHDNAVLDEDDEDEEAEEDASPGQAADGGASDEEDMGEIFTMSSSVTPRSRGDRLASLSQIQPSHLEADVSESLRGTVYFTPKPDVQPTPRLRPGSSSSAASDYFNSKWPDTGRTESPVRTPRPADIFGSPSLRIPASGNATHLTAMPPGSPGRPALYHLGSRSMIDLLSTSKIAQDSITSSIGSDLLAERCRSKALPGPPNIQEDQQRVAEGPTEPADVLPSTITLRRQRSMPIYKLSSDPPPYPSFHPRRLGPAIQPRDEEGRERLPSYSNAVYLYAVMPRKVEFSAPGVQARDRKWRRVLCVLEGTAFRVYKCPLALAGVSAIESWWEKKVGVGDITVVNTGAVTQSGIRVSAVRGRSENERTGKEDADPSSPDPNTRESQEPPPQPQAPPPPPSRSKLRLAGTLLHPSRSHNSKMNSATTQFSNSQPRRSTEPTQSQEDQLSISVVSHNSTDVSLSRPASYASSSTSPRSAMSNSSRSLAYSPPASSDSSSTSFFRSRIMHSSPPASPKQPPEPNAKDLLRMYTLQHAESGLASDYGKRKNVIRVRMEGEQFLLQAPDVAAVIDWIEGIQAATNIALDLDERPMPKGPMFPRRRRRRARTQAGATGESTGGAAATTD